MSETGILYPPLPPPQSRSQHFQKKCAECTRSHRQSLHFVGHRNDIILKKSHELAPPHLLELILLEVVYNLMIAS